MATAERDYYEVLGLRRDADDAEIKKAFRGLARQVHPDVSDAPDADERFKEVVEAYEVLSNSETRELYDRYGHAGLRSGGFNPTQFDFGNLADIFSAFFGDDLFAAARGRGADVAAEVDIALEEAAKRRHERSAVHGCRGLLALCGTGSGAGHRGHDLPHVRGRRPDPARLPQRLRRVHPDAGLPAVPRSRPARPAPL